MSSRVLTLLPYGTIPPLYNSSPNKVTSLNFEEYTGPGRGRHHLTIQLMVVQIHVYMCSSVLQIWGQSAKQHKWVWSDEVMCTEPIIAP